MNEIITERLSILPMSESETEKLIEKTESFDPELAEAYGEMLSGARENPEQYDWYAVLEIKRRSDGKTVGDACFKGLPENGFPEIGYGIHDDEQNKGYATEAVRALCAWALAQDGVNGVEAEVEESNEKSKKVIFKCGFEPNGTIGKEGPRFTLRRKE